MQLAGAMPSAMQVGGAPPNSQDPAAARWDAAFRAISALADSLQQQRREEIANKVAKLAVQLQHMRLEQQKKIAENAANNMPPGNNALTAASGMHAQGVPENT